MSNKLDHGYAYLLPALKPIKALIIKHATNILELLLSVNRIIKVGIMTR